MLGGYWSRLEGESGVGPGITVPASVRGLTCWRNSSGLPGKYFSAFSKYIIGAVEKKRYGEIGPCMNEQV